MQFILYMLLAGAMGLSLMGCEPINDADQTQKRQTEQLRREAASQVGMPAIVNFAELRDAKENYELRDTPQPTIAYLVSLDGKLHKLCDSIGYGLPYGVQFTNPQRVDSYNHSITLPQPEPNGLFMPEGAEGTWVKCLDPADKKLKTVYVEPRVIVSPFPLQTY